MADFEFEEDPYFDEEDDFEFDPRDDWGYNLYDNYVLLIEIDQMYRTLLK